MRVDGTDGDCVGLRISVTVWDNVHSNRAVRCPMGTVYALQHCALHGHAGIRASFGAFLALILH